MYIQIIMFRFTNLFVNYSLIVDIIHVDACLELNEKFYFQQKGKVEKKYRLFFINLFEMNVTNKCSCICTWYVVGTYMVQHK